LPENKEGSLSRIKELILVVQKQKTRAATGGKRDKKRKGGGGDNGTRRHKFTSIFGKWPGKICSKRERVENQEKLVWVESERKS